MRRYALNNAYKTKNSSKRELFQIRTIKVISGNFSTVDMREEPCYTEPPEKGKYGGETQNVQQNVKRWAAVKNGPLQAGQRKARFRRRVVAVFSGTRLLGGRLSQLIEKA